MSSDQSVQLLLGIEHELDSVEGVGVKAECGWDHVRRLETHVASEHGDHLTPTAGSTRHEPRAVGDTRLHPLVHRRGIVLSFLERSAEAYARTFG